MSDLATIIPRPLWQRYIAVLVYLLLSVIIVTGLGMLLYFVDPASLTKGPQIKMPFRTLAYSVGLQIIGFALPAFFLLKFARTKTFSFYSGRFKAKDIALCCTLILVTAIAFNELYKYLNIEPQQLGFLDSDDILAHKYGFIFFTGILAPVYEEWVFRGLIFGVLVKGETGRKTILFGSFFCVLLFTLVHIEGKHSLSALPPILVMALIFQYVTWKSKNLWPAVFGHAMQNILASAILILKLSAEQAK